MCNRITWKSCWTHPRISDSVSTGGRALMPYISSKFPGDPDATVPGTILWEPPSETERITESRGASFKTLPKWILLPPGDPDLVGIGSFLFDIHLTCKERRQACLAMGARTPLSRWWGARARSLLPTPLPYICVLSTLGAGSSLSFCNTDSRRSSGEGFYNNENPLYQGFPYSGMLGYSSTRFLKRARIY